MKLEDEVLEDNDDRKVILRYTALGVVGAIVPWNFPILLAIGKMYVLVSQLLSVVYETMLTSDVVPQRCSLVIPSLLSHLHLPHTVLSKSLSLPNKHSRLESSPSCPTMIPLDL
jgi:hypothetical protein